MLREFNGKRPRVADSAFVSEASYIVGDVEIGEESNIWPGAVIRADQGKITIGKGTSIEDNCVIHSSTPSSPVATVTIGDGVILGHGSVMNGRCIGDKVLIGMNSTILHDAEIGSYCIIGACCLVGEEMKVPDYSFVIGVPGKIKGRPTEKQLWWVEHGTDPYQELALQYKSEGL